MPKSNAARSAKTSKTIRRRRKGYRQVGIDPTRQAPQKPQKQQRDAHARIDRANHADPRAPIASSPG